MNNKVTNYCGIVCSTRRYPPHPHRSAHTTPPNGATPCIDIEHAERMRLFESVKRLSVMGWYRSEMSSCDSSKGKFLRRNPLLCWSMMEMFFKEVVCARESSRTREPWILRSHRPVEVESMLVVWLLRKLFFGRCGGGALGINGLIFLCGRMR